MNFNLLRDTLLGLAGLLITISNPANKYQYRWNNSTDGKEIMFDYLKLGLSEE